MHACNGCHDSLMMSENLKGIAIFNINGVLYRITKTEAVNLLQNDDLSKKEGHYKTINFLVAYKKGLKLKVRVKLKLKSTSFANIKAHFK